MPKILLGIYFLYFKIFENIKLSILKKYHKKILLILLISPIHLLNSLEEWMYVYHPTLNDLYIQNQIYEYQIICITGYKIDQYGNLKSYLNISKYQSILENKIVYPLISLTNSYEGKILLSNKVNRKNAIQNIILLSLNPPFRGIHIDFEYLTEKESHFFAQFLKELKEKMTNINKKLTIAIFPPIWQLQYNKFHKIELISPYVDEIVIMTYDFHNPKTEPGPVSELNWIKQNLNHILKYVQKEKIYVGIPLYGYEWEENTNQYRIVDNSYYKKIINSNLDKIITKSITFGTQIKYFDSKNKRKILYYPDIEFRNEIKKTAMEYNVKGIAYWRLGFEK